MFKLAAKNRVPNEILQRYAWLVISHWEINRTRFTFRCNRGEVLKIHTLPAPKLCHNYNKPSRKHEQHLQYLSVPNSVVSMYHSYLCDIYTTPLGNTSDLLSSIIYESVLHQGLAHLTKYKYIFLYDVKFLHNRS